MQNLPAVTLLSDLPVVIDGPGVYRMRNGDLAEITIVRTPTDTCATFKAQGGMMRMFRGSLKRRGWWTWHVSGRRNAVGPHAFDILAKA